MPPILVSNELELVSAICSLIALVFATALVPGTIFDYCVARDRRVLQLIAWSRLRWAATRVLVLLYLFLRHTIAWKRDRLLIGDTVEEVGLLLAVYLITALKVWDTWSAVTERLQISTLLSRVQRRDKTRQERKQEEAGR